MERHILTYSYWLGVVCLVVALVWKGLRALEIAGEGL